LRQLPGQEVVDPLHVREVREVRRLGFGDLLGAGDLDALDVLQALAGREVRLQRGVVGALVTGDLNLDIDVGVLLLVLLYETRLLDAHHAEQTHGDDGLAVLLATTCGRIVTTAAGDDARQRSSGRGCRHYLPR